MGDTHQSRARSTGNYIGIAIAAVLLIVMALLAGMAIGETSGEDRQVTQAARTGTEEPEPEQVETEPEVSLVVPTKEPSGAAEPVEGPSPAPHTPSVQMPEPRNNAPQHRSDPAQLVPTPQQQKPRPTVNVEPEFICPSGEVRVSLDAVEIGPLQENGVFKEREVHITGTVTNATNGPVRLWELGVPSVYAIDSSGEPVFTYHYPEYDYTPPPGEMSTNHISLPPGESLTFHAGEAELARDVPEVTHVVMDEGTMYPDFDHHVNPELLYCLDLPVVYGNTTVAVDFG